jgi:molybdopterin/thiamine biosynthesis adenylyltransferase
VRLGVRSLTLIDPDAIEAHNLGEMDTVTEEDLGAFKVEALAKRLRSLGPKGHNKLSALPCAGD